MDGWRMDGKTATAKHGRTDGAGRRVCSIDFPPARNRSLQHYRKVSGLHAVEEGRRGLCELEDGESRLEEKPEAPGGGLPRHLHRIGISEKRRYGLG